MVDKTIPQTHANVFLSYSHNDSKIVEIIAEKIINAGFSCWIDKNKLRAQENFNVAIDSAINESIIFIAFLSKTYVNKPYCIHEFERAIDKQRSILVVCIDDVNESTNRQASHLFSFSAGHNILGFGVGICTNDDTDIVSFADSIINSIPMEQLKRYSNSGDEKDYPPISTPDYIMAQLRLYHEKQYRQSGNYALNEIRNELFPAIKNTEMNILYRDENNQNVSLIKFFSETEEKVAHNMHILITGEGGMGKTVSLLKTCEYLLNKRINAIYVPLSKIDAVFTLDQYLERVVCGGNQFIWKILKDTMSTPYTSIPNVVILLDGINEIPLSYVEDFVGKTIKTTYIDSYQGIKLVMTSRWFDNSLLHKIRENIVLLEMQSLDRETIELYLNHMDIPSVLDEKILSIIRTPLMLTLFADVEKHKNKYQHIEGIVLEENPNTAGKILSNFFQTQLYRAAEEENFDRASHIVLLEYLLPNIAYTMLEQHSMYISENKLWDIIDEIDNNCERYQWYKKDKLRRIIRGKIQIDTDSLIDLAESSLHFLHKSEDNYEFLHQSFRDYFAAYSIANELYALNKDSSRLKDVSLILQQNTYSDDILRFVSDIIKEETVQPLFTDNGWHFPEKNSIAPSKKSVVETILSLWRNKEGDSAQNAVANIINIMKIGRKNLLAWCDFSYLDLRKCWLNKCRFTLWYKDQIYPSIFDGAFIDRANFLTNGHESTISAITFDGHSKVFSGDRSGVIKIYNITDHSWIDSLQLQPSTVIDLSWNDNAEVLAIMYENIVFCYSVKEKVVVSHYKNNKKNQHFRYVRFSENGELNVSFNLQPLIWYDLSGNELLSELSYDVPAKCAKWHPRKKEFIRSHMLQLLSVICFDESTLSWKLHPALQEKVNADNIPSKEQRLTGYLCLRDFGITGSSGVNWIQYNKDGSRVLVAIQNLLIEYDTERFDVLNKKICSSYVYCACYLENEIAVGMGANIVFLDSNFSEEYILQSSQIKSIRLIAEDYKGNGYYLFSLNGEIKKLDRYLTVQRIRFSPAPTKCRWVRDRLTDDIQMAFLPWKNFPYGSRYTYETDYSEPLGWRYEFIDTFRNDEEDEQQSYTMDSTLLVIDRYPPYRKRIYTNYTGIWIFGCSFNDIRGDMGNHQNINFLIQNGGIVNVETK